LLDGLDLNGPAWRTTHVFDDGPALLEAVCRRGFEGMVAKRLSESYKPGKRSCVKIKNRRYWRFPHELAAARQNWRSAGVRV